MNSAFFDSKYLERKVYFSEVEELSDKELTSLRAELRIAVTTMEAKVQEDGEYAEPDWLYGVKLKINICKQFLERIDGLLDLDSSKLNHYHLLYLRQEIANHLGAAKARQLFDDARAGALTQLRLESKS